MKKLVLITAVFAFVASFATGEAFSAEKVLYSFEEDVEGWEIPDWAFEKEDYVGNSINASRKAAKIGRGSLEIMVDFPGGNWTGAIVEILEYFDWTPYSTISCDVYLPKDAPAGLRAKMVLTVGDSWKWTEMSRSMRLTSGEWTTISANLKPGSTDWKRTQPTDEFRADVRKLAVRISSNKPAYKGPVYIDNIVLSE